jgi:hypothetical protein
MLCSTKTSKYEFSVEIEAQAGKKVHDWDSLEQGIRKSQDLLYLRETCDQLEKSAIDPQHVGLIDAEWKKYDRLPSKDKRESMVKDALITNIFVVIKQHFS